MLLALLGALVGLVVLAGPASAHAVLEQTTPVDGADLATGPTQVTLRFGEQVEVAADAVHVLDGRGTRVDAGAARHPGGRGEEVAVGLRTLAAGSYLVEWRVVSADSHPVAGAFTFSVGRPSAVVAAAAPAGSRSVGILDGTARWLGYAGLAGLVGGTAFLLACWPSGSASRRLRRLLWSSWGLLVVATLAVLVLQGPYGAGTGLARVGSSELLRATLHSRLGRALGARMVLLGLAGAGLAVLLAGADGRRRRLLAGAGVPVAVGLALTWAVADHAGVGGAGTGQWAWAGVPVDVVHLLAMSVWLGGLAVLAGVLLPLVRTAGPTHAPAALARALPRFSRTAFACVVLLMATGSYQSWRDVGTPPAYWHTAYGRLLLAKLVVFAGLVALGSLGRTFVARHYASRPAVASGPAQGLGSAALPPLSHLVAAGSVAPAGSAGSVGASAWSAGQSGTSVSSRDVAPSVARRRARAAGPAPEAVRALRRSVGAEAALGLGVLALTAVLVESDPARSAYSPTARASAAFDTGSGPTGRGVVAVELAPARVGADRLDVSVRTPTGGALAVAEVTAALTAPAGAGALPVALVPLSPGSGRLASSGLRLPVPGRWSLALTVRTSDVDETTVSLALRVR